MAELSIFIDESGDVGSNSKYYLLTLVFHNQDNSIQSEIERLDMSLKDAGFTKSLTIHTGPIIRREESCAGWGIWRGLRYFYM